MTKPDASISTLQYTPAYKMVLSGLSEHSFGCGTFKRTVWHAQLIVDYHNGRLYRNAGDFLCKKLTRSTFDVHTATEQNLELGAKVNCKQCLEVIARAGIAQ
jgi:hypothetical protein